MKIEANELMIGNYVNYKDECHLFEVIGIDILGIRVKDEEQETWIEYDCFEPIPLTEEWLVRFGFEKTNEDTKIEWYNLNGFDITITEDLDYNYIVFSHIVLRHVKHVHQLQNLYFTLKNEHLTNKQL